MDLSFSSISVSKSLDSDFASLKKEIGKLHYLFYPILRFLIKKQLLFYKKKASKKIKLLMDRLYLQIVGSMRLIDSYDSERAKSELKNIRNSIHIFDELKEDLKSLDYFDNEELREITSICLSELFNLEHNLKKIAYKGKAKPADQTLKLAMASSSFSITKSLN
jgi:hypothetical protein